MGSASNYQGSLKPYKCCLRQCCGNGKRSQNLLCHLGIYVRPPRFEDQPTVLPQDTTPTTTTSTSSSVSSVAASVRHSVVDFRAVLHHHHPHHSSLTSHSASSSSSGHGTGSTALTTSTGSAGSPASVGTASTYDAPHSPTPQLQRRLAKSFSVAPSGSHSKGWLFIYIHISR